MAMSAGCRRAAAMQCDYCGEMASRQGCCGSLCVDHRFRKSSWSSQRGAWSLFKCVFDAGTRCVSSLARARRTSPRRTTKQRDCECPKQALEEDDRHEGCSVLTCTLLAKGRLPACLPLAEVGNYGSVSGHVRMPIVCLAPSFA